MTAQRLWVPDPAPARNAAAGFPCPPSRRIPDAVSEPDARLEVDGIELVCCGIGARNEAFGERGVVFLIT
jgi:hypothetical protein